MTAKKKPTAKKAAKKAAKPKKNFDTLVVGATYRTRGGGIAKVEADRGNRTEGYCPFTGTVDGEGCVSWCVNGMWATDPHEFDLVELISLPDPKEESKPAIKLEVGKTYPTREGGTAVVVAHGLVNNCIGVVITKKNGAKYLSELSENGTYFHAGVHGYDIILPDTRNFPWSDMPKWAKWVAMEDCGDVYYYSDKPKRNRKMWSPVNGETAEIPPTYLPDWYKSLPWDQSLLERPEDV